MEKLKLFWNTLRSSLWFIPGIMIFLTFILEIVLIEVDSRMNFDLADKYPRLFGLGADGSRGMLTAIASSMLTVATFAFTMTLNAVTQASGQFTPRIFRVFLRDRPNQFVLGYFVSAFVYCLLVLRTIRGGDELRFVPSLSVITGLLFALGGVVVLIYFIHRIADSLQITKILDNITQETKSAIEELFPATLGEAATPTEKQIAWRAEDIKNWTKIPAKSFGYIRGIDEDGLLEYAIKNDLLVKMQKGIGQFTGSGSTLVEIAPDTETAKREVSLDNTHIEEIQDFFSIDRYRTVHQDVGFGIRQIVDIALKALSPGVNDTTTAIESIDNLSEILGEIARRKLPTRIRSADGVPRVMTVAENFSDYVEMAFDQIRISGKANYAIFVRLLSAIKFVADCTKNSDRLKPLKKQVELISEYAEQTLETEYEKEKVRQSLSEVRQFFAGLN